MDSTIHNFHHLGLIATNLDAMIARYEQLGFAFTPISHARIALKPGSEPIELGAGNRCAIFQNNYLEVLGILDRPRWDAISKAQRGPFDLDEPLSRYEGLHVMHFATDDIVAVRERLVQQGTACSEIADFQRNVETPEGQRTMHAKTLYFPHGSNPEGLIQMAQHLTPELVLQPRYMHHPNGAQTLTESIVCTADPAGYAAKYERYSGQQSEQRGDLHIVDLGYSRIIVVAPEHLDSVLPESKPPVVPFLAGFTVATANLDATRKMLEKRLVPFQEYGGRLLVQPENAGGCAVLFEKEGAGRSA